MRVREPFLKSGNPLLRDKLSVSEPFLKSGNPLLRDKLSVSEPFATAETSKKVGTQVVESSNKEDLTRPVEKSSQDPGTILNKSGRIELARGSGDEYERYSNYQLREMSQMQKTPEGPYDRTPINDIDDYDVQRVDQLSGWKAMNATTAKALSRREPVGSDWSDLPTDSDEFQVKRKDFIEGTYSKPVPDDSVFKALEGGNVQPPDQEQLDAAEAQLMATYAPKNSAGLTTYSVEDAKDFIKRYYDKMDVVPEIVQDPKYPNVYQVVGVDDKHPKITWEPAPASPEAAGYLGEETIRVPQAAVDRADPFFFGEGKGYKSWTPGLERMFAPSFTKSSWY